VFYSAVKEERSAVRCGVTHGGSIYPSREALGAKGQVARLVGVVLCVRVFADGGAGFELFESFVALQETVGIFALQQKHSLEAGVAGVMRWAVGADVDARMVLLENGDGELAGAAHGVNDFVIDILSYESVLAECFLSFFMLGPKLGRECG
jgi:hypothetical protein